MIYGLNESELLVGFLLTLCLTSFMGVWGLVALIICPLLYALSGMKGQDKVWRRLVMPIVWACAILAHTHHWTILLAIPCSYGALTIGYGIIDLQDKGSALGNFYLDVCKGNYWWANFLTRGTIYGLALLPMLFLGCL